MSGLPNGGDIEFQPTFTVMRAVSMLPIDSMAVSDAPKTLSVRDRWADAADTTRGVTKVAGCTSGPVE